MHAEIRSALRGCKTVLDVGCGTNSPMRLFTGLHLVGMDGHEPSLAKARENGTHDEYLLANVNELVNTMTSRRFDACVAFDVIEHLNKEDGWKFMEDLERLVTKRVIISTPNGFLPQRGQNNDLQEHLSGWTASEFRSRGFKVTGLFGWKKLRGEYHHIKYQPQFFWALVSLFSHFIYTRKHPESAAALFCVKDLAR